MKVVGGRYRDSAELRELGLGAVGDDVMVHETAQLVDVENIRLSSNVRIDPFCILSAVGGSIQIGSYVHIAAQACIFGGAGVVMENFSGISHGVKVYSVSDNYSGAALTNPTVPPEYGFTDRGQVVLRKHVIVGSGSVILPSVEIGEGSAVGALSLVTKSLEPWGMYMGCPVRRLKDRRRGLLEKEQMFLRGKYVESSD
jgi:dTDP-4-amino-4,6-dideoxy-D-glucose acyltransferase